MIGRLDPVVSRALAGCHQSIDARGRVGVTIPKGHPLRRFAYAHGFAWRARLVAALVFGRRAVRGKDVHHLSRVRNDDRVRNLEALTRLAHRRAHSKGRNG